MRFANVMNDTDVSPMEVLENAIRFLRFPLLVGIVLIHCDLIPKYMLTSGDPAFSVMYFFSQVLCRICVPIYFMISGFLFFYRLDSKFNVNIYLKKLSKRVKTLLVPYIIWNMIGVVVLIIKVCLPSYFPGLAGMEIDFKTIIDAFWDFRYSDSVSVVNPYEPAGYPINFPLWFMRDLMILSLVTPLIYFLIKHLGVMVPILMLVLFVGNIWYYGVVGFEVTGFTFFVIGAYFSIKCINPINYLIKLKLLPFLLIYIVLAILDVSTNNEMYNIYIHRLGIVLGSILCLILVGKLVVKVKLYNGEELSKLGFFIYVFHGLIISILSSVLCGIVPSVTDALIICVYFMLLIITVIVSIVCYKVCKKIVPQLLSVSLGGK